MPVMPNALERLLLRVGLAPSPIIDVFGAAALRAATAAIDLGLFEMLRKGPRTTAELAGEIDGDPVALDRLLVLLERAGYLRRNRDAWMLSADSARWLVGDRSVAYLVWDWGNVINDLFADLPDTIRRGRTLRHFHEWLSERPERWRVFNQAMADIARGGAAEIAKRTPLPTGAKRVIDIGGNHAINAIAFCRRYPDLRATVFDIPEAFGDAQVRVREAGLAERIVFAPGDFTLQPLGTGYDAALLFNVLHYQRANENVALLRKAHDSLVPGGRVVILEQLPESAPTPTLKLFLAFFDLFCVTALGGGVASYSSITAWLTEAGYRDIRKMGLRKTPASSLIVATRS